VGLTKYNVNRPVRPLEAPEAARAVEQVERARSRAREERGAGWCYAADELFLHAGMSLPGDDYYDDWSLVENGVGAVNRFLDAFDRQLPEAPRLPGRRIRLVTGHSMAPFLRERAGRLAEATGAEIEVLAVRNGFYGETVTVAGLLSGRDILRDAGDSGEDDIVLIPAETLNQDDHFIDSLSLQDFRETVAPARVVPGYDVIDALRSL
jgi:NifB/MoaA-like Fe-S oxidoreductase